MPEPQHLQYFPRRAQFCGNPSFAPILFSVDGVPGPYLSDIVKGRVVIDAANDAVFEWHGWKATPWTLDVRSQPLQRLLLLMVFRGI